MALKLKRRKNIMAKKKVAKKVVPVKNKALKKATIATICAEVIFDNEKAGFNKLCSLAEKEIRERGILSYVIQNIMNDVLDATKVFDV